MHSRISILTALLLLTAAACDRSPTDQGAGPPAAITVTGPDSLRAGEMATYSATVTDSRGREVRGTAVTWASSNPAIASFGTGARLTAHAAGSVSITASAGAVTGTITATITPPPALRLSADTLRFDSLGAQAVLRATVEGDSADFTLQAITEHRWNSGRVVAYVQGDHEITASAAGRATFLATPRTGSATPDTLVVIVEPTRPYVLSVYATNDSAAPYRIHGWKLEGLPHGSVTVDGDTITPVVQDSANLVFSIPPISQAECRGSKAQVTLSGVTTLGSGSLSIDRPRAGEVKLALGEAVRLGTAEQTCLRLTSGRYILAYYDAQYMERGTQAYSKLGNFAAGLDDVSDDRAASGSFAAIGSTASGLAVSPTASYSSAGWSDTTEPWAPGDTIEDFRDAAGNAFPALVLDTLGNRLAIVVPASLASALPTAARDSVVQSMRIFVSVETPHLEALFGVRPAAANGQYVLALKPRANLSVAGNGLANATQFTFEVPTGGAWNGPRVTRLILRGIIQSHALVRINDVTARTGGYPVREKWNWEGLPDFIAYRYAARRYGLNWTENASSEAREPITDLGRLASGEIEAGYEDAASLLFDLTWRLAEKTGWSWESAHDSVAIATWGNRWGCTTYGCDTYDGLYDLMQRHFGEDWDPVDAVLTYTVSQVLDDQIQSSVFRNPAEKEAGRGFLSQGEVVGYSGAGVSGLHLKGGSGFFEVQVSGGAAFSTYESGGSIEWMLVRIQ